MPTGLGQNKMMIYKKFRTKGKGMIKNIIVIYFLFSLTGYAQNKDEMIKVKDTEIKILKERLQNELESNLKINKEDIKNLTAENLFLKDVIKETNKYYLKESFDDLFTEKYFKTRDLSKENDSENFILSGVLVNSIKIDAKGDLLNLCNKALSFNENYLTLLGIRENVLNKKYEEKIINESLDIINKLPALDETSNLNITKKRIYDLLFNYRTNICSLRKTLDNYQEKRDQKAIFPLYEKLEKDPTYKDYPYFKEVINAMKKDVKSFNGDDDLLSCLPNVDKVETDKIVKQLLDENGSFENNDSQLNKQGSKIIEDNDKKQ